MAATPPAPSHRSVSTGPGLIVQRPQDGVAFTQEQSTTESKQAGRRQACGPPADVLTGELLSRTYGQEIEVAAHPRTGAPVVLPRR